MSDGVFETALCHDHSGKTIISTGVSHTELVKRRYTLKDKEGMG